MYEKILKFIIGGILILCLDYLAKIKNNRLCAIIPALPILWIIGLYFTYTSNGNSKYYVWNIMIYLFLTIIFYLLIYLFIDKINIKIILPIAFLLLIILIYSMQCYIYD